MEIHIGEKLDEILNRKKISKPELANMMGVDRQKIYYVVSKESIDVKFLIEICNILQVPIKEFLPTYDNSFNTNNGTIFESDVSIKKMQNIRDVSNYNSNDNFGDNSKIINEDNKEKLLLEIEELKKQLHLKDQEIIELQKKIIILMEKSN